MKKSNNHGIINPMLAAFCAATVLGLSGCKDAPGESEPTQEQVYGPRIGTVLRLAGELGVKERHLMAAGYVGGYFGLADGQKHQAWLAESGRSASLALDLRRAAELQSLNFRGQMDLLAKDIQVRAERQQPLNDFDWLTLIAQAIVGDFEPDPNISSIQVRMVLMDLIEAHNTGFSASLNDKEVYTLRPADEDERIDLRLLDPGQLRLLNGSRAQGDGLADLVLEGNTKARVGGVRATGKMPKLVIRLCPSTALRCFEAMRKTSTFPAHFLSYRTMNGNRETVQFHDHKQELVWNDEVLKDTITLMVAGTTGTTRESLRPDLFDWEDYVALRSFVRRAAGRITEGLNNDNPNAAQREFIRNQIQETTGIIDENSPRPNFALGPTWDSELFRELLNSELLPKQLSQVKIDQPLHGQSLSGTVIEGVIYPDAESAQIQIYQDASEPKSDGSTWDLVLKRDLDPRQRRFDFTHEIRRSGLNGNQMRSLKVVNRKADGSLLGSRVIRLRMEGIVRP
jgi:hypothetical protein